MQNLGVKQSELRASRELNLLPLSSNWDVITMDKYIFYLFTNK